MANFRYRAAALDGALKTGAMEAASRADVLDRLRRAGLTPIEAVEAPATPAAAQKPRRIGGTARQLITKALGELAVLLNAGLPLDRALAIVIESITRPAERAVMADLQARVKEGVPLARAMAAHPAHFSAMAAAMTEAGEANGALGDALARLAETLERAENLRQTVASALVYPILLMLVSGGVILVMLLAVVPQFEGLFGDKLDQLPTATQLVVGASRFVRHDGLAALLGVGLSLVALSRLLQRPAARRSFDRFILRTPGLGALARDAETARFARVLGSLIDGGVALPTALGIARRALANSHMAEGVESVAQGLKQGGGLSGPLAATGLFPPMALSFLRTGEETARLGMMLGRLADVLDQQVRQAIQRLIGVLTPAITILLAGFVAVIIAAIMTAILSFNDLALAP